MVKKFRSEQNAIQTDFVYGELGKVLYMAIQLI